MRALLVSALVAVLVSIPGAAVAAEEPERYFLVTLSATGDWAADYGDEGKTPGVVTAAGVDGTAETSWSWEIRAVARSIRGGPVTTLRSIMRARYDGRWSLVSFGVQQGVYSATPLCTSKLHRGGQGVPGDPAHGSFGTTRPPAGLRGRGAWVSVFRPDVRIGGGSVTVDVDTGAFLGLGNFGCYHDIEGHGSAFFDEVTPKAAPVPRGAFNPRFDRRYRETFVKQLGRPRGHDVVNDANQLHTTTGTSRLIVDVKSVTERAARTRAATYRETPAGGFEPT